MALKNFSSFYYGIEVTTLNRFFDFDEGGSEINAEVQPRIYAPEDFANELERVLNSAGSNLYTVSFNRASRRLTISSNGSDFNILASSGVNAGNGVYQTIGLPTNIDQTGGLTYTTGVVGRQYLSQFPPQSYTAPEDFVEKEQANVSRAASGFVEVIDFGNVRFLSMELLFITNKDLKSGEIIRFNPNGLQDARDFLSFAIRKGPMEFMPDYKNPNEFYRVILESTDSSSNGVGFRLKEEIERNLPEVFRTGILNFRVV
jgi:hypothetical protein